MLRAVLFGALWAFTVASCGKQADAPAVAVGAAAGKVIELTGKVTATREGKTRDLAIGGDVFRDDQLATAADATVTIELFHNGARWSVVSNKQARVDTSLAWSLDKQEAANAVEHNSAAAGRNAERTAADTASTTDMKTPPAPGAATTPAAPITEAAPAAVPEAPPVETKRADKPAPKTAPRTMGDLGGGTMRGGKRAPAPEPTGGAPSLGTSPPPPPPPPPPPKETETATRSKGDLSAPPADVDQLNDERARVVISPQTLLEKRRPELQKCVADGNASNVTLVVDVRANKTTTTLKGTGVTATVRACVDGIVQKIEWPVAGATTHLTLKL